MYAGQIYLMNSIHPKKNKKAIETPIKVPK
jgi:hypothetical protein